MSQAMPPGRRRVRTGLALVFLLALARQIFAQEANLQPMTLNVGFTRSSFRNVNASDATAVFRVFAQTVSRKHGYQLDATARLFESPADCEAEIKKGSINMAILDAWDFLSMDIQQVMEPTFVHLEQGTMFNGYLLLTHRGSGLTGLADLRGKDIMVLEGKGGNLSRAWLDCLLLAEHFDAAETFFGRLQPVTKPTAAVLPVFFGTKPVCLVDRATLQIMSELNPQVGNSLVISAASDPYLENITCISKTGWPSARARQDLIEAITELHTEANGRQILELFRISQLVPFKDEYLNTVRKLRRDLAAFPASRTRSDR